MLAFVEHTNRAVENRSGPGRRLSATDVTVIDPDGMPVALKELRVDFSPTAPQEQLADLHGEGNHEQPTPWVRPSPTASTPFGHLALDGAHPQSVLRSVDKVIMIGCGTASYAGQVARYAIEHWCRIPSRSSFPASSIPRPHVVGEKTPGRRHLPEWRETMNTTIRHAREQRRESLYRSTISRESTP